MPNSWKQELFGCFDDKDTCEYIFSTRKMSNRPCFNNAFKMFLMKRLLWSCLPALLDLPECKSLGQKWMFLLFSRFLFAMHTYFPTKKGSQAKV